MTLLVRHQRGACAYGLQPLEKPSLEHVIPQSLGGDNRMGNILVVETGANHAKADRMPTGCELIALMAVNSRMKIRPFTWAQLGPKVAMARAVQRALADTDDLSVL